MAYQIDFELQNANDKELGISLVSDQEDQQKIEKSWQTFCEWSPVGKEFVADYDYNETFDARFAQTFKARFGIRGEKKAGVEYPGVLFVWRIEEIISDLIRTRDVCLVPKVVEVEEQVPTRPSEAERFDDLCAQVRTDIDNPVTSSKEINDRRRTDPAYAKAFNHVQAEAVREGFQEMAPAPKPEAPPEIKRFAHIVKRSTIKREPGKGEVSLSVNRDDSFNLIEGTPKVYRYPVNDFDTKYEQAQSFGLL